MKLCALILPYFGKPKNYFQFFLYSLSKNPDFDLLLYTDMDESGYDFPSNVIVKKMTLEEFKAKASQKFGFEISLENPHKICDYKPAYGYLFEEDIQDYAYWGYCDCDLIFGDLSPVKELLNSYKYRKLFAAGHLTIYKNTIENNRVFMRPFKEKNLYKIVYTHRQTFAFDEDEGEYNVHKMFLSFFPEEVYAEDLSFNVSMVYYDFHRTAYRPDSGKFILEKEFCNVFYNDGHILSLRKNKSKREYIYCHLQGRNFPETKIDYSKLIEISPKGFFNNKEIKRKNYFTIKYRWVKNAIKRILHYKGKKVFPDIEGIPTFSV